MSLTTAENGAVTLEKARLDICMEAAYELDVIANMLPDAVERSDDAAMESYLRVRCMASRVRALASALMMGLSDEVATVGGVDGLRDQVFLRRAED